MSRAIFRRAEIPWILIGAMIPDIPWIFQRIFLSSGLTDPFQTRLYFTAQASLVFCLLLCACSCTFSRQPVKIFSLLAFNSLLHLILDALQIKWGNGVHLLAPFSWQYTSIGLLWPEHVVGYILSLTGISYLVWKLPAMQGEGLGFHPSPQWKIPLAAGLLYILLPFVFMHQLEMSNPSFTKTLKNSELRTGKAIEIDRSYYSAEDSRITLFTGESIDVTGRLPEKSGTISLKGRFITNTMVNSERYHRHNNYRDLASKTGIALTITIWMYLLLIHFRPKKTTQD